MPERVLVTGATGFIGSALCRALISRGYSVRALHRATSSLSAIEKLPLELVMGDILDPPTLIPAMQGVGWVFHAAAQSAYWRQPREVERVIIQGTRNVMQAALQASVQRVILTSSLAAMGIPRKGQMLTEENTFNLPRQRFPYGHAKRQSELEAFQFAERGLQVVVVNPSAVLGPGDRNQISGSVVIENARRSLPFYPPGGMNVIHIEDVVAGHLAAARLGRPGERYILGAHNLSHRQILTMVAEVVGHRPPKLKLPGWSIRAVAPAFDLLGHFFPIPLDGNQLRLSRYYIYCDSSKARRELHLPAPIPFHRTVRETYMWYREHGVL